MAEQHPSPLLAASSSATTLRLSRCESCIGYQLWLTGRDGRITAKAVADAVALDDYAVMLCGPRAFVADLARQFRAIGLPSSRIITEELQFR